jgi:UDP-glucuronate decarboxylase
MDPDDGRVVSNFIVQALRGEPLTIYGDGSQTRSFCYVDDLVRGIIDLMEVDGFTGPMNLGNDGEFTVRELAEMVLELTGSKSKITYLPLPQDDPIKRRPDLSLAREKIGYAPAVPLREGLIRTIEYFKNHLKRGS